MSSPTEGSRERAPSIGVLVSLALVTVITLLLGTAGAIAYASFSATRWEDLHRRHRVLADQLATGLSSPLWNFDRPTLTKMVQGAFEDPMIVGVVIRAADDGSIVYARARQGESGSAAVAEPPEEEPGMAETRPILFEGEPIGSVKVLATGRFVEGDLRSTLGRVALSIVGLDLAVVLVLYFLLRRIVLRPLQGIEQYAQAVSSGRREDPAPLQESLRGELSRLQASIVSMIGQLDARFGALEKGKEELKQANEALARANSELASSNGELQEYAYVASHDLQEPLRAVAGCVQLLQQRHAGKLDARSDELISHTVDGVLRMQTLIEDLLTLSRVATKARPPEAVELTGVFNSAIANLRTAIQEAGAVITRDDLPSVRADATQMLQLVQNLLGNAVKFHGAVAPIIHVGARRGEGEWRIEVRDNGIGIEAQYFERIFRLFQRLHTRREYPGTGIGLAVCKKIVDRHGGRIGVESMPGRGSTFWFTIPDQGGVS